MSKRELIAPRKVEKRYFGATSVAASKKATTSEDV